MLAKTTEKGGKDWDRRLPYVLFSYHASQQESTLESPFFLLYGRDPRLPTQAALTPHKVRSQLDLREYGMEVAAKMSEAWQSVRMCVTRAQRRQKKYYDQQSRLAKFAIGERVFLFRPEERSWEAFSWAL